MTVTQEQIEKLSQKLCKMNVDTEKLTWNVNSILDYMNLLNEIDTKGVKPTVSVIENEWVLREDIEEDKEISRKELLDCTNQKVIADQIAITSIMK